MKQIINILVNIIYSYDINKFVVNVCSSVCVFYDLRQRRTMKKLIKTTICITAFSTLLFLKLDAQMVNVTLEARNVWGDNTGYQLLLDETATQYGVTIPVSGPMSEICFPPENLYDVFTSKIPENSFPSCSTNTVVADGSITVQIPAGVYDWCITNPDPASQKIWMAGGNGENSSIRKGFIFEAGYDYHFLMTMVGFFDGVVISVTQSGTACPKVTGVTSSIIDGNKAKIMWNAPVSKGLSNYKIYQNDNEIALVNSDITEWTSNSLTTGNYTFAVAAVYASADDCVPVKVSANTITIYTCDQKVNDLTVNYDSECTKATISWTIPLKAVTSEVYNNGPFITHPGQGFEGSDASAVNAPYSSTNGVGANMSTGNMVGDDFELENDYYVETIDFFAYQQGAGVTSTITGIYVQIYDGSPKNGGTLIWGNTTTNRLVSTSYSNVNRVSQSNLTSTDRRIMKVTADIGVNLFAGVNYWVAWGFTGSLSSGPFQIPVTIFGQPENGNGLWKTSTGWQIASDQFTGAIHNFAFKIYGSEIVNEEKRFNVYRDGILIANQIEDLYFEDHNFDKFKSHTYSVAVECINGGDGEWTNIVKEACSSVVTYYTVTLSANPQDGGTVNGGGDFEYDEMITVTAEPNPDYSFVNWTDTEGNELSDSAAFTFKVNNDIHLVANFTKLDISDVSQTLGFIIFPNPVDDILNLHRSSSGKAILKVFDCTGVLIQSKIINENKTSLDVSSLSSGVYTILLIENDNFISVRLVK